MPSRGLKETASALPETPGVYLFKDARGRVLYVGKALSLRDRVRSYFSSKPAEEKTGRIDEEGTIHKGTNWFNEEKKGRTGD